MAEFNRQVGVGVSETERDRQSRLNKARNSTVRIPDSVPSNNESPVDIDQKKESPVRGRSEDYNYELANKSRSSSGKSATNIAENQLKKTEDIVRKYGWRELDTFLLGLASASTLSVIGIVIAIVAIIFLDIRWVLGHTSQKIPKMIFPQAVLLFGLNFVLMVVAFMVLIVTLALYCVTTSPADAVEEYINLKSGLDLDFFNSCF